jgi:hypothetical protein
MKLSPARLLQREKGSAIVACYACSSDLRPVTNKDPASQYAPGQCSCLIPLHAGCHSHALGYISACLPAACLAPAGSGNGYLCYDMTHSCSSSTSGQNSRTVVFWFGNAASSG